MVYHLQSFKETPVELIHKTDVNRNFSYSKHPHHSDRTANIQGEKILSLIRLQLSEALSRPVGGLSQTAFQAMWSLIPLVRLLEEDRLCTDNPAV